MQTQVFSNNRIFNLTLLLAVGIWSESSSFALSPPNLSNLNLPQVDAVFKTFDADFAFRPVEPASAYGKYWGVSAGVIAGATSGSAIRGAIPGANITYVPSANIFLGLQGPFGLGVEFGFLPTVNVGGFHFSSWGGDVKWTATSKRSPADIAFRGMYSSTSLSYGQSISGISDTISYTTKTMGANVSVSKRLLILEPYVGVGVIKGDGTLSNTGTITLFNQSVSLKNSYSRSTSSPWYYGGLQMRLLILTLSAEYDNMFGIGSGLAKLALKF